MTDTASGNDQPGKLANPSSSNASERVVVRSRSDGGTILLHWLTAFSVIASLLTGLRISADGLTTSWAKALEFMLPQGEMWTWHMLASIVLAFCTAAYVAYVYRARLVDRNGSARLRTLTPPTNSKLRLRAINVALHWFCYAAIAFLTISGTLLYIGYGGLLITIHKALAWTMLIYIFVHTIAHFLYGGIDQLLRLFRPQPLIETTRSSAWPTSIAIAVGLVVALGIYGIDETTKPGISAKVVSEAPLLDGKLDDAAWQNAAAVTIPTQQGINLGGSGSSDVEVRAARSGDVMHFAFRWYDPTRSLMRSPTIKKADGWYVMSTGGGQADVNDYYEDKFSVLFSHNDAFGGGGSTFLGKDPLPNHAKSPHGRGFHYTDDGRVLDLWQWKASRGGMIGHVDDMHFGPPKQPTTKQKQGKKRYAAGYAADPGKPIYEYNYIADGPNGYESPVRLKRLPSNLAATVAAMGDVPENADGQNSSNSVWWMTPQTSVAYTPELDARIPEGTIIPSTLNIHTYAGDRADLSGGAVWRDGYWTLEVSRKLVTGSAYDIDFLPGTRLFMWVSVFDHNQIRHTRHQRPIILDIE